MIYAKTVLFFAALCFVAMPQSVLADDWTYDFEEFSTVYGDHYANSSFDVTLNGLTWHCHGVSYSKNEDYDWFNGTQSMELYGESKKDRNTGPEISVFQLKRPATSARCLSRYMNIIFIRLLSVLR